MLPKQAASAADDTPRRRSCCTLGRSFLSMLLYITTVYACVMGEGVLRVGQSGKCEGCWMGALHSACIRKGAGHRESALCWQVELGPTPAGPSTLSCTLSPTCCCNTCSHPIPSLPPHPFLPPHPSLPQLTCSTVSAAHMAAVTMNAGSLLICGRRARSPIMCASMAVCRRRVTTYHATAQRRRRRASTGDDPRRYASRAAYLRLRGCVW